MKKYTMERMGRIDGGGIRDQGSVIRERETRDRDQ